MSQGATDQIPDGPFVLSGPVTREIACQLPIRGDLAHIGLAGRYFVPHYIVPQTHTVKSQGVELRTQARGQGDLVSVLQTGETFEVLDIAEGWAWGCCSIDGPSGYVPHDSLGRVET